MHLAKSFAVSLLGLSGTLVEVEADISSNLPGFVLVGLPDASLSEASARVRAAIVNSKLVLPARKITVNLSPAAVPKFGSSFDLAIAISVLAANQPFSQSKLERCVHIGELGLDGSVRAVNGVLPAVVAARDLGFQIAVVPMANLLEARLVSGIQTFGVHTLRQAVRIHEPNVSAEDIQEPTLTIRASGDQQTPDIADVFGQDQAVESMIIAAAGGHHMLMIGSPGVGKTMMAERFTSLLPDLSLEAAIETTAIHSIAKNRGAIGSNLIVRPPFEAPHHTASAVSLIGGGSGLPTPGLVSLANHGVLFLDEAPEFQQPALEVLRQALESGQVVISRSAGVAKFPAKFQLLLAANPCPCGNSLNPKIQCVCTATAKQRYLNRLSGPLLDRVDIRLQIQSINATQALIAREQLNRITSADARAQVERAREMAKDRFATFDFQLNSQIPGALLRKTFAVSKQSTRLLDIALKRGAISMRGYDRCLRLARTICDLEGLDAVDESHISRAVTIRGADRFSQQAA